jgi:response regulator RpfG family c-di-GMP phosphodiesterase
MKESLFSLMKNTVNVLIVDDRPDIILFVKELLDPFKIYSVAGADSTRIALDIIESREQRFHVCLFDLGLDDVKQDEFYLLDKYGRHMPFIITSATEDTEKAFECKKRGAKEFVRKGAKDFATKMVRCLNDQALNNMICPKCLEDTHLCKYVDVLTRKNPQHVNAWAEEVNLTDRQLRYEWESHLGFSPKHSLCIYHLFSKLFKQVEIAFNSNELLDKALLDSHSQQLLDSTSYKRFLEYYFLNQREVSATLCKSFFQAS